MIATLEHWTRIARTLSPLGGTFIDGEFADSISGATFDTINPANGAVIASVARGGDRDIDRAVRSARAAFERGSWSRLAPAERKEALLRLAKLVRANADELAVLDSLDGGKLISDTSTVDVPGAAAIIQWYGETIDKIYGEVAPTGRNDLAIVTREALGVVGAVIPWNYPLEMAVWKVAPALAAGNSVVLKPAEESPLSALRLAQLAIEAGIPTGVFNVVPGLGREAGRALGEHMHVDSLVFTGSTPVGKAFLRYSAESNLKQVWPECGGKSANVIFADTADLDLAAEKAVAGIFACTGQVCSANSRLLIEEEIADVFTEKVIERASALRAGDTLDPATTLGPVISETQLQRVLGYIAIGRNEARLALGGDRASGHGAGFYLEPTIFTGVDENAAIAREEIFGPVLAVSTFRTEDEAIRMANASEYGLAASVWTNSLDRALRVSRSLNAGTVSVNTVDALDVVTPFGGVKQSGFGRDLSLHALDKFTSLKTTWFAS